MAHATVKILGPVMHGLDWTWAILTMESANERGTIQDSQQNQHEMNNHKKGKEIKKCTSPQNPRPPPSLLPLISTSRATTQRNTATPPDHSGTRSTGGTAIVIGRRYSQTRDNDDERGKEKHGLV
jgi:hypothetical protein